MTAKAVPTVQIDNERVRVTEWRFAPGAETGFHVHGMDYVVVPSGNGRLKLVAPDGAESFADDRLMPPPDGAAGFRRAWPARGARPLPARSTQRTHAASCALSRCRHALALASLPSWSPVRFVVS